MPPRLPEDVRFEDGWLTKLLDNISKERTELLAAADLCEENGMLHAAKVLREQARTPKI